MNAEVRGRRAGIKQGVHGLEARMSAGLSGGVVALLIWTAAVAVAQVGPALVVLVFYRGHW